MVHLIKECPLDHDVFKGLHNTFKSHAITISQLQECRTQKHILSAYDKLQLQT